MYLPNHFEEARDEVLLRTIAAYPLGALVVKGPNGLDANHVPFVIDEASGFRSAGALVAGFGISNTALLDVLAGKAKPQGKLPFAFANNLQAVIDNQPDAPGYPAADTLYPFGYGLTY